MKTIVDFLMDNGNYSGVIGNLDVSLEPQFGCIVMCINGEESYDIEQENPIAFQDAIQDILYDKYETEIRFCEECGKPMDAGYIAGDGNWYSCEECFDAAMDKTYGKGKWRSTEAEGRDGGYYEALDGDEWDDTGIFYTEWN